MYLILEVISALPILINLIQMSFTVKEREKNADVIEKRDNQQTNNTAIYQNKMAQTKVTLHSKYNAQHKRHFNNSITDVLNFKPDPNSKGYLPSMHS